MRRAAGWGRGIARRCSLATQGGCSRGTTNLDAVDGGDNEGAYLDAVDARCGEGCVQFLVESGGACVVLDQPHAEERRRVPCNLRGGRQRTGWHGNAMVRS